MMWFGIWPETTGTPPDWTGMMKAIGGNQPMWISTTEAKPHKCPICEGKGKLRLPEDRPECKPSGVCHGCGGKGWVVV